ncbi:MAG: outer membrane protein assembly factor BamD [Pseudomonadota bacterium]|nr:outer membrane protein assembly factor BamD [Pseudomonadota bacterium]MDQ3159619.1 outer membrane protein assembly factor BamD [Pseudomonadota bacterium]
MTQRSPLLRRPMHLLAVLAIAVVLTTSGCARVKGVFKDKDKNEGIPVSQLYDRAHGFMEEGRWSSAGETFTRLIAQYPYGAYTEQALMEQAYAEYKAGKHDEAVSTIDRFIRTYPTHKSIAYLYYLRGLSNMARNTVFLSKAFKLDMSNRDLQAPQQAYSDFSTVATRYPSSRYAADARQRMVFLRNEFARFELNAGLYYLGRSAWVAAADRGIFLLETYPQSEYQNDAVALLAESYTRMGNTALATDARRVLQQNDPQHPWLQGNWPKGAGLINRLNPFGGDKQ